MQAAEMTGVSRSTIGKMIRHGKLKLNAFGQIPISEIDRALGPDN
jgi:excisionase family DNA binding protein